MVLGGTMVVRADLYLKFQIWSQRVIMGAQYVPSRRTYTIVRFIGVFIVLMGLAVIVGWVQ